MSVLEVTFPDEWRQLPVRSGAAADRPVTPGAVWVHGNGATTRLSAARLLPPLSELDADGATVLVLADVRAGASIQAFCTIGVVSATGGDDAGLRAIAEHGRYPDLERDTCATELSLGRAVRSSAFRFAEELLDDESVVPFSAEVRFALPLPGPRIGVLHFETLSLAPFAELERCFDAIAGTARVC